MQEIKVFDLENKERDFEYAKSKYGVAFRRAKVGVGQKVYRLIELWEKTGHHSLITQLLDENNNPMDQMDIAFYWPDAPDPPDPPTTLYDHDWYRNFKHGLTNLNGDVGPGMGGGAWIDVDLEPPHNAVGGGPHAVWVRDPNIPSDICERLGMRGGTNHDHLDQKFKLMTQGGDPMTGKRLVEVDRKVDVLPPEGVNENHIAIKVPGSPGFYETYAIMVIGDDLAEPDHVFPDRFYPAGLNHYNLGAIYDRVPGELSRTFWVTIHRMANEVAVSNPIPFVFNTGEGRRYTCYMEWQEEVDPEEPPPDPEPPPPDPDDRIPEAMEAGP